MNFPRYFSESEAKCFSCGEYLQDVQESGYAPGHGCKMGQCACGYATWFDLYPVKAWEQEIDGRVNFGGPKSRMHWREQER